MGPILVCSMVGRVFTLYDLKRALIASSGGQLESFYHHAWDWPLWELVEAIEIVQDINKDS
jgi:hypothetical protein